MSDEDTARARGVLETWRVRLPRGAVTKWEATDPPSPLHADCRFMLLAIQEVVIMAEVDIMGHYGTQKSLLLRSWSVVPSPSPMICNAITP